MRACSGAKRCELQDEHVGGRKDHNYRLWMIFNLEMFLRHYMDGESVGALEDWIRERAVDGRPAAPHSGSRLLSELRHLWAVFGAGAGGAEAPSHDRAGTSSGAEKALPKRAR